MSTRCLRLILVLGVTAMLGCPQGNAKDKDASPPTATVVLRTANRTIRVAVELARTPEQRARGLMFRKHLEAYRGMLFLFEREEQLSFWMQNTYIPLDMVFINSKLQVVGIVANAEPLTTTSRRVAAPSRYVLEVRGGFAKTNGLDTHTKITFEGVETR